MSTKHNILDVTTTRCFRMLPRSLYVCWMCFPQIGELGKSECNIAVVFVFHSTLSSKVLRICSEWKSTEYSYGKKILPFTAGHSIGTKTEDEGFNRLHTTWFGQTRKSNASIYNYTLKVKYQIFVETVYILFDIFLSMLEAMKMFYRKNELRIRLCCKNACETSTRTWNKLNGKRKTNRLMEFWPQRRGHYSVLTRL